MMMMMSSSVGFLLMVVVMVYSCSGGVMGAAPRRPVDVPFGRNYVPTWAFDHIKYFNGGSEIHLHLDKYTGTGFQSKGSYLFGHFSMHIKMVPGDSAGTVTAFYLSSQNSEHDEIDFEFLGNRSGQPYILQTNVYTGGKGDKEQRINLWFDPTKDFHTYSVLWNLYQIVFFVDDVPIRVFKNSKDLGVKFPFNQPMKIYSSLWNADDWATRGGLEKTDWSKAPFVASYKGFHVDGCEASVQAKFCDSQGKRWWDQKEFQDLDSYQWNRLNWVRKTYTIYNYCTDRSSKITKLILDFFSQESSVKNLQPFSDYLLLEEPHHQGKKKGSNIYQGGGDEFIRSATELNEAGICIEKSKTKSLKDISFSGGLLKLP